MNDAKSSAIEEFLDALLSQGISINGMGSVLVDSDDDDDAAVRLQRVARAIRSATELEVR